MFVLRINNYTSVLNLPFSFSKIAKHDQAGSYILVKGKL